MKETLTLTFSHKMRSNKEKCFVSELKYHHNNNFSHFFLFLVKLSLQFFFFALKPEKEIICNFCIARCNSEKAEKGATKQEKSINFILPKKEKMRRYCFSFSSFASHYCAEIKRKLFCAVQKAAKMLLVVFWSAKLFSNKSSSHSRVLQRRKKRREKKHNNIWDSSMKGCVLCSGGWRANKLYPAYNSRCFH